MAPKDFLEFEDMLEFAISHNGPIAIRYPRGNVLVQAPDAYTKLDGRAKGERVELAKAEILRVGKDVAILAIGDMAIPALEASHILADDYIQPEVVNMRFIKPIDKEALFKISDRIKKFVVIEDNVLQGGFGSSVIETLNDGNKDVEVMRIGLPDRFITHGKRVELLDEFGLSAGKIAERVRKWLK